MFDGLWKSKFYTKCKSDIKLTRTRIEMIKKKRNAMQKYLRNDVADLLKSGLDTNAYNRVEGLLVEINRSECYEFIDQCCALTSNHLTSMDKQRECPEECRGSISSLMFAAARIADLPELRELRNVFSEKYGNSFDCFANKELVEKLKCGVPSRDKKLQLLQEIAADSGLAWNSKALENKLFNEQANEKNFAKENIAPEKEKGFTAYKQREVTKVEDKIQQKKDHEIPRVKDIQVDTISNAVQVAKHDVMDWTCTRGWLNLPVGLSMEHEIYKSASTLRNYCQVARLNPEKSIPLAVLKGAKGLAILTVAKAGVLLAYKLGTGLVVARRSDGSWSAPSAILSVGLGWGAQAGGELMDFIIVMHDAKAVKTFCSRMHFSLGAGCSAAAGPIGRVVEADLRAGEKGSGLCYTYSCSKGAFVGVSLEGNIVSTRMDTNLCFYGDPYITTTDILLGTVDRPKAAEPLYSALKDLYAKFR